LRPGISPSRAPRSQKRDLGHPSYPGNGFVSFPVGRRGWKYPLFRNGAARLRACVNRGSPTNVTTPGDDDASMSAPVSLLEQRRSEILAAIIGHHSLATTLQYIADSLVALYPSKAMAIFLLSGRRCGWKLRQAYLTAPLGLYGPCWQRLPTTWCATAPPFRRYWRPGWSFICRRR